MISRKIINHIFHNKFPYRVSTTYPASGYVTRLYPHPLSHPNMLHNISCFPMTPEVKDIIAFKVEETERYKAVRNNFMSECLQHVPEDKTQWSVTNNVLSFHFYFVKKQDMEKFIEGNESRIKTVYEPASGEELDLLKSDKTLILRNSLFHNQYQFCIHFKMNASLIKNLDEWVDDFFGDDPSRYRYNPHGSRRLYLATEDDILIVRLAFSRAILKIEKIILRSNLNNENIISEEIS